MSASDVTHADAETEETGWEAVRDLPPSAKLVAKVLEYNDTLTQSQLADETLLPPRTVRYALNRLEAHLVVELGDRLGDLPASLADTNQDDFHIKRLGRPTNQRCPARKISDWPGLANSLDSERVDALARVGKGEPGVDDAGVFETVQRVADRPGRQQGLVRELALGQRVVVL